MLIPPKALSTAVLSKEDLKLDRENAKKFGPCALGNRALYVGSFGFNCATYIPIKHVERVYKRLAVTKGYFNGGIFGALAYLVVRYDGGKEKVCRFKYEEDVNMLLSEISNKTAIPVGKK